MRGVGPAGRWFTAPNVRGRNMVTTIGGSTRVGRRMLKRKDYLNISVCNQEMRDEKGRRRTHSELSRAP